MPGIWHKEGLANFNPHSLLVWPCSLMLGRRDDGRIKPKMSKFFVVARWYEGMTKMSRDDALCLASGTKKA